MLRILATALFALFISLPGANAQQAEAIDTCGTLPTNIDLAKPHTLYMNKTGQLCVSGTGGGGGGGDASAANQTAVQTPVAPATATATKGVLLGGIYNSTLPTFTNGQQGAAQLDSRGRQIVTDDQVLAAVQASIPAGSALIGDVNVRQGGTALSATNGAYFNQLQGNAALSATNPSFSRPTDGTSARVFDPCEVVAHVTTPINISSAATSVIVAGTASKKTYICSMMLFSAGTSNVGIVQGSGSTCGTSTLGLIGGATSATGPNLTAQAGFVAGNGNFAIAGTTVNQNDICLINGSAIQVSGYIVTATP